MQGRRVEDVAPPWLEPGDYCFRKGRWWFRCPDGSGPTRVDGRWTVEEHDDGTITVTPSIDLGADAYHGHLTAGVWT